MELNHQITGFSGRVIFFLVLLQLTLLQLDNVSSSAEVKSNERKAFQEIEALLPVGGAETTLGLINTFLRTYPRSSLTPSVENIKGLLYLKEKRPSQAMTCFTRALELSSNQTFNQYILYNLAAAQLESHLTEDAEESIRQIHPELLDQANQFKLTTLQVAIFDKKNQPLEAARFLLGTGKQLSAGDLGDHGKALSKILTQKLQAITDISTVRKLLEEYDGNPFLDALLLQVGSQELTIGNREAGLVELKKLVTLFPSSIYYEKANELISNMNHFAAADHQAIGLLLPLKGKFAKFGSRSLQGIELALGVFGASSPDSKIKLILEDSGDDAESSIQGLNRLIFKHHVVAVIGPMLSKGIDQISQRAQELGVPLISLSRRASPVQDFVFQAGLTQQIQAYELARYAIQKLGLKKLAILFPSEKFGTEFSTAFWDAAESFGGEIVGIESYPPTETDFRNPVDKLSGLFYPDARQAELEQLARDRTANHIIKRTRRTEQFFALKPIIDFEAVFLPDEVKLAGQIMPTFSYRDIEGIKFLGTSSWNTPDLITRAQGYGENAFFVDAFFPDNNAPLSKKFFQDYKATFNQDPSSLEAIAYDAAKVLQSALATSANPTRTDVRDQLKAIKNFSAVTGTMTYKKGQFFRDLKLITSKGNQLKEWTPIQAP
jgi:ABC-type branched-subunit amino acid transport system substrate-binding protein